MANDRSEPPRYTRYRARPRLSPRRDDELRPPGRLPATPTRGRPGSARRGGAQAGGGRAGGSSGGLAHGGWRRWARPKRIALGLVALVFAWLALSLILLVCSGLSARHTEISYGE